MLQTELGPYVVVTWLQYGWLVNCGLRVLAVVAMCVCREPETLTFRRNVVLFHGTTAASLVVMCAAESYGLGLVSRLVSSNF